jgi:hypothetical protein
MRNWAANFIIRSVSIEDIILARGADKSSGTGVFASIQCPLFWTMVPQKRLTGQISMGECCFHSADLKLNLVNWISIADRADLGNVGTIVEKEKIELHAIPVLQNRERSGLPRRDQASPFTQLRAGFEDDLCASKSYIGAGAIDKGDRLRAPIGLISCGTVVHNRKKAHPLGPLAAF